MADIPPGYRFPLLILGFISLLLGMGAGLARMAWDVPGPALELAAYHAPLMIGGFFGTVISLERAVALAQRWSYLGPLASGTGGFSLVLGAPLVAGQGMLLLGSTILAAGSILIFLQQRALFTFTMALGAVCWLIGNIHWLSGASVHDVVPWWTGFLILTIAGERLELSRFLPPSPTASRVFRVILAGLVVGMILHPQVLGVAVLALALWLLKQDIARRTVRDQGLTRYIAVCLLSGYAWLAVAGLTMLVAGLNPGTQAYDVTLHALMLGFVFAMVFGHAPIIFPAVLKVTVPYHPVFYLPLLLLHLSLLLRVLGDATANYTWRSLGGLFNAITLLVFIATMIAVVIRGRRL